MEEIACRIKTITLCCIKFTIKTAWKCLSDIFKKIGGIKDDLKYF